MVDNLIIVVGLLLAFVTGFILCLKSVNLGLKWKIQVENKQIPTIDNPITEIKKANLEAKVTELEAKQQQYMKEQMQEYLYGE